ncbi:MAG: bile acid:sodium symporter [Lentisphaeria bacterium]|nr:bile acid:sodium symporter [Lentisphaeria bacterium]
MFKKLFLPVGLLASVVVSMIFPQLGTSVKQLFGSSVFILLIFLVCGYQTDFSNTKFNRRFLLSFLVCGILSLLAAPWLGVAIARGFRLDMLAMTGLIVMASVPPTLSSGIVMTETAEGNIMLGVMMTVFYNLLGVLTMPLVITWTLASKTDIDTNPLKMFLQLLMLVVLPFAAGFFLKKLLKRKLPSLCGYIPSSCVILLILSFFSSASAQFKAYPVKVLLLAAAAGLVMRLGLLLMLWVCGGLLKMNTADRKAAIFTAGSKTLTIALAILAILDIGNGPAVIPCMVFYFLQSMIDSVLAGKMGLSAAKARAQLAE